MSRAPRKPAHEPAPTFQPRPGYERDGVRMIEIAPGRFVNETAARALGMLPEKGLHHD